MSPATRPPERREDLRLLVVDGGEAGIREADFVDLPTQLRPGDLLVVNDAATLPASLMGESAAGPVELRLLGLRAEPDDGRSDARWAAVLFGAGDWREDTDARAPTSEALGPGDRLRFAAGLEAELIERRTARLVELRFDRRGPALWSALYRAGRPVQYSHLDDELELWSVQTLFAGRPWAVEMPSAGRGLSAGLIRRLRERGVELARLTHAAGLSATGDRELDAMLPLPERYEIPAETVAAIRRARALRRRVVAVGTTVVRALEAAAAQLEAGDEREALAGEAELIVTPEHRLRIVDALLTGMHGPGESHFRLLGAFVAPALLERAWSTAVTAGYRSHEFGDVALLLAG